MKPHRNAGTDCADQYLLHVKSIYNADIGECFEFAGDTAAVDGLQLGQSAGEKAEQGSKIGGVLNGKAFAECVCRELLLRAQR